MKQAKTKKSMLLAAAICAVLSTGVTAQDVDPLIKEQQHNIYHVIKDKSLLEVVAQLANRTGFTFKINAVVENDVLNKKLAADDWKTALTQLLGGYNYSIESDRDQIKTVVITGRNGSGFENPTILADGSELVVIAPNFSKKLPEKYQSFNAGSVMNVDLPMSELANIPVGDELTLDLPIGQYTVKHDNFVDHGDGTSTWIGYLGDEGKGYRVYISQGETGVIGNVYTPDGAYNIETVDGQTVIVDIDRSGLQTAGFEHDEAEATADGLMQAGLNSANANNDLKNAAETARAKANALMAEAKTLNIKYQQTVDVAKITNNTVNTVKAIVAAAKTNLENARAAFRLSPQDSVLRAAVVKAASVLNGATSQLTAAMLANATATQKMNAALTAYNKKLAEANAAEANAKTAEAAYANQLVAGATSTVTSKPAGAVVDLMVLYTTTKQTAEYAKQRIRYLVDISNQAYKDSGINMSLRLVHTRPTSYVESNANSQALYDLATDRGVFAGTAALRNQYGADLVVLFRPLYAATAGSCGTAYVGFANGGNGYASTGYGTIGDGYSKDAKSNYYCGLNTFTHEIGHSLGNVHDREYSSFQGKFPYSYAWGVSGKFGTIMSYYGPSVMLFSTPNLTTQCAGTACGFPEGNAKASDQTSTINYTAPIVANYKATTVSVPVIQ